MIYDDIMLVLFIAVFGLPLYALFLVSMYAITSYKKKLI